VTKENYEKIQPCGGGVGVGTVEREFKAVIFMLVMLKTTTRLVIILGLLFPLLYFSSNIPAEVLSKILPNITFIVRGLAKKEEVLGLKGEGYGPTQKA
jgi:hypothetical protein